MNAKLLVAATMLLGATAMAEVKVGANIATSIKSTSEAGDKDGQFNFDQGRMFFTGGNDTLSYYARLKFDPSVSIANKTADDASDLDTDTNGASVDQVYITYTNTLGTWNFGRMFFSDSGLESSTIGKNSNWSFSLAYDMNFSENSDGVAYSRDLGFATGKVMFVNNSSKTSGTDDNNRKSASISLTGKAMEDKAEWFFAHHTGHDTVDSLPLTAVSLSNVWLTYGLSDNMNFAFEYITTSFKPENGDSSNNSTMSLYGTYIMNMHAITLRYEMQTKADDNDDTTGEKRTAITLTDKVKLEENLSLYAEYRMDGSDEKDFTDADGEAQNSKTTVMVGLAASF